MTVSPNPLFKFHGGVYAVRVENVPQTVNRQEIVNLFTTLIGEVRKCDEYFEEGKRRVFDVGFANPDTAKKALCMTGYTVAGVPMHVSACRAEGQRPIKHNKQTDERRNLYVLGLPFDLTKSEFVEVFSRYGGVAHAVILATVDNASRRRGFVVMNSHREAKLAMEALGRTEIKGHTIDVSWAVVQRSQGFLDGGDRTMILSNSGSSGSSGFDSDTWDVSPPSSAGLVTPPLGSQTPPPPPSSCSTTLLVTNLPSVLFSQPADLQPLLCPFGEIKNLQIVNNGPGADKGNISVVVEYKTLAQAMEARDSLSGQVYTSQPVQADFMAPKTAPAADVDAYAWPSAKAEPKIGLNPYAPPFLAQNAPSQDVSMMPFASHYAGPVVKISEESVSPMPPAGSPSDLCLPASYSPAPWNLGLRAPQGDLLRPRSAPSRPGNGVHDARPGWWTCSTSQALPDLSSASLRSPFIA